MITKKQQRQTKLIELAETHNLAISLNRIYNAPGFNSKRVERALYHAIQMSNAFNGYEEKTKIRIALGLP